MIIYDYVLERSDGVTQPVFNITIPPEQYADMVAPQGFTIVKVTPKNVGGSTKQPTVTTNNGDNVSNGNGKPIYRLMLKLSGSNAVDTGATYPQCSRDNPSGCDPQHFATADAAIKYAIDRGETPVYVRSVDHAWQVVEGKAQPGGLLTSGMGIAAGGLLLLWAMMKRKR